MTLTRLALGSVLVVAGLALSGCYETTGSVLDRGVEAAVTAGVYRCVNEQDREASTATVSAPARLGADDVIYVATIDKDRYAVRVASLSADLFLLEARGAFSGAQHIFLRKTGADAFALLIADTRADAGKARLAALAARHGATLTFPNYGAPRIEGPREAQRAFLLGHTSAVLERTATCRRTTR